MYVIPIRPCQAILPALTPRQPAPHSTGSTEGPLLSLLLLLLLPLLLLLLLQQQLLLLLPLLLQLYSYTGISYLVWYMRVPLLVCLCFSRGRSLSCDHGLDYASKCENNNNNNNNNNNSSSNMSTAQRRHLTHRVVLIANQCPSNTRVMS